MCRQRKDVIVKGIVFSFNRRRAARVRRLPQIGSVVKSYRHMLGFAGVLLAGLVCGAVYAHSANSSLLQSLDFLFMTNLEARLAQGALGTFCACFASDFIFLLLVYLFGMTLWGIPFVVFTVMLKGFGTGLTAGYLSMTYALSGVGFYLLVLLPGTFLFCFFLAKFSASAFVCSKRFFISALKKDAPLVSQREQTMHLSSRFLTALIATFTASLLDTVLWTLFAGAFKF